ncbi:acyl-CoA dehydrogenase family protein [Pseudomonas sp. RIT-PI-AD]|uniref:acyl-CoA dehydrogenase family protein n=1 Tax=Pseudomonas sp. RIT-PI-AD TaxID=3035294 RepID=UPI0021D8A1FD|nr:acyl-CoA dehydrogenase family protein [Pseudomonas sp. RIT-PI-AD]
MRPSLLKDFLQTRFSVAQHDSPGTLMGALVAEGMDRLPYPGSGRTLERWQALAEVAGFDLGVCKLYEGHTDALAIMAELGAESPPAGSLWGTWAAEPPQAKVSIRPDAGGRVRLDGRKSWCSGAAVVSHGLITAWDEKDRQQLVAVELDQAGVSITDQGWRAVGMAATGSVDVLFEDAVGYRIGDPEAYLHRPGFWQGGGGIAACWYGAAVALAEHLRQQGRSEPHALAHLGSVDACLQACGAALRACAAWIDANPHGDAQLPARRARAIAEDCAERVLRETGRALGAQPYCRDPHFARLSTDLPVFLRQSHAERDLAALGELCRGQASGSWAL